MRAEGFAGVAGGDAAVNDGGLEIFKSRLGFAVGGEPTSETAEEGITGTCGVKNGVEGVGRASKEILGVFSEQEAAVFTALDDDETWALGLEAAACFDEVGGACELLGFAVIDDEEVDFLEDVMQALIGDADPEIHGIGRDEIGSGALLQSLHLVVRAHVRQNGDLGSGTCGGELGGPMFQDIDRHIVGGAAVHVIMVFATPSEGGSRAALQAIQSDAFAAQQVQMTLREIMADDAHEVNFGGENAGCQGCIGGRAAEQVLLGILRGLDIVQGDGSGDDD